MRVEPGAFSAWYWIDLLELWAGALLGSAGFRPVCWDIVVSHGIVEISQPASVTAALGAGHTDLGRWHRSVPSITGDVEAVCHGSRSIE